MHCHLEPDTGLRPRDWFPRLDRFIIESDIFRHAVCPSWYLGPSATPPWDERLSIDASLLPPHRSGIRMARDSLLALLDAGARQFPADEWIAGQRVRFALDQGDTTRALNAATTTCTATRWWCLMLEGLVRYGRGEIPAVDAVFDRGIAAMPKDIRCQWNDFSAILDTAGRAAYRKRSCTDRDSVNRVLWWLADPSYLEPGNDRRDEQMARKVMIALRSAIPIPERWDWDHDHGGSATREMIERYGWPAFSEWAGPALDEGHYNYLGAASYDDHARARFTTAEYPALRFHTVPSWLAISDPFNSELDDWDVWEANSQVSIWWPNEHFARTTPIVQPNAQIALLRREHDALLAVASSFLPTDVGWPKTDSLVVHLFTTTSPDSVVEKRAMQRLQPTTVVQSPLPSHPMVVSLELTSPRPRTAISRVRFGAVPPKPLTDMKVGDIDISRGTILRPVEAGAEPPSDPAAALADMAGSTTVRVGRIGIYWETYGIGPGDTVDVSVSVSRPRERSTLGELGSLVGLGGPKTEGLTIAWREPSSDHNVTTIPGRIPIQGRELTLDLSHIEPGYWTLTVSVARPGKPAVSRDHEFRIVEP